MTISIDLGGSTALVTGASQGIGAAIADTLHRSGARVVVNHPDIGGGKTREDAQALVDLLNSRRADSALVQAADVSDPTAVSPDGYSLDNFYLARPGADEVQLDLFGDYKSNVALYPTFQKYFKTHKPPLLAVWGKNDPFFLPPGAEAFKRDIPAAVVRFLDTGHFAVETHAAEIAAEIRKFMDELL